ncbi:MAG: 30S ribosomal protein S7 [Phycisphaeraceae bacterium]|nr:30S ribosomal protein S7 [Phycisphaerales bacterium]QOJ17531.1 MAG: 30S ribosomal protein S7 [Phycisphaeraceae bacterium]
MAGRITKSDDQLRPDPRFQNTTLAKFINCVMHDGKKAVATRVVYDALDMIQQRLEKENNPNAPANALAVFLQAVDNVRPSVEVRSKRVGGANYQVPMQVRPRRQQSLAFRWIITAAREEKGKPMAVRLAKEIYDAAKGEGKAITTRENTHRMAEANKAFAHFAW